MKRREQMAVWLKMDLVTHFCAALVPEVAWMHDEGWFSKSATVYDAIDRDAFKAVLEPFLDAATALYQACRAQRVAAGGVLDLVDGKAVSMVVALTGRQNAALGRLGSWKNIARELESWGNVTGAVRHLIEVATIGVEQPDSWQRQWLDRATLGTTYEVHRDKPRNGGN